MSYTHISYKTWAPTLILCINSRCRKYVIANLKPMCFFCSCNIYVSQGDLHLFSRRPTCLKRMRRASTRVCPLVSLWPPAGRRPRQTSAALTTLQTGSRRTTRGRRGRGRVTGRGTLASLSGGISLSWDGSHRENFWRRSRDFVSCQVGFFLGYIILKSIWPSLWISLGGGGGVVVCLPF